MDFRCTCGAMVSTNAAPGTVLMCPTCLQQMQLPEAASVPPAPPEPNGPASAPPLPPLKNTLAATSLMLGIFSLALFAVSGIPAVICGAIGLARIKKSNGQSTGAGLAVAGIILGGVLTLVSLGAALIFPGILFGCRPSPAETCRDNLRQIGVGILAYASEQNGFMPPGDLNTCAYIRGFVDGMRSSTRLPFIFECPSHPWLPDDNSRWVPRSSCTFNVSPIGAENIEFSPYSFGGADHPRHRSEVAPDTILLVEMWTLPGPDGAYHDQFHLNDPNWSRIDAGLCPISSYRSTETAKYDSRGRLLDPGPYRFLDCYKGSDTPVWRMYHRGRINVLFADCRVEALDLRKLTETPPSREPRWTAARD